jgi:DNA-directed RNA polymerase specialized sigma24 family protein
MRGRMSRTFEELAGDELDALYQGALFLSGGNARGAESLLVEAVTLAFEEHATDTDHAAVQRWLEARLVRSFLRHLREGPTQLPESTARRVALDPATFESLGSRELFAAAAALPAWPRAALWLVLLRRWSYLDAAAAMDIDAGSIEELLGYRDVLLQEMMSSSRGRQMSTGTS